MSIHRETLGQSTGLRCTEGLGVPQPADKILQKKKKYLSQRLLGTRIISGHLHKLNNLNKQIKVIQTNL